MKSSGPVVAKLRHMIDSLEEYADSMESSEHEAAFEAADGIGSEEGDGCSMCEHLSSSLSASVAYAMWFPDEEERAEIEEEAAQRAREYADGLKSEFNESSA